MTPADFVADWIRPFLSSILATSETGDPELLSIVMKTGHSIFYKRGVFIIRAPGETDTSFDWRLQGLLRATADAPVPTV